MKLIVAVNNNGVIGDKGQIPWVCKEDLRHFARTTKKHVVIMGRNTWESLPKKARPLKNRHNIIISNTLRHDSNIRDTTITSSIEDAFEFAYHQQFSNTWIIGGANVYDSAIRTGLVDEIHITNIENDIPCDTFFPNISKDYQIKTTSKMLNEGDVRYRFETHVPNYQMKILFMYEIWQSILRSDSALK